MELGSDADMLAATSAVAAGDVAPMVLDTTPAEDEGINRRVYVGNLSWDTRWQGLKDHMRQAGEVIHAEIFFEGQGRSAGCGVVEYESTEGSRTAIAALNDSILDGRPIFVREDREGRRAGQVGGAGGMRSGGVGRAGGAGGPERGRKLVVWNLPFSVRWQVLKDHFRPCGNVIRADIIMTPDGKSKGMGTVVFETEEEAQRAIAQFSGSEMDGRIIDCRLDKFA